MPGGWPVSSKRDSRPLVRIPIGRNPGEGVSIAPSTSGFQWMLRQRETWIKRIAEMNEGIEAFSGAAEAGLSAGSLQRSQHSIWAARWDRVERQTC